jgi:hypothetical protein
VPARVRRADEAATEPLIGPPAWTAMPSVEHVFTRLAQVGCQWMLSTGLVGHVVRQTIAAGCGVGARCVTCRACVPLS